MTSFFVFAFFFIFPVYLVCVAETPPAGVRSDVDGGSQDLAECGINFSEHACSPYGSITFVFWGTAAPRFFIDSSGSGTFRSRSSGGRRDFF